jgi:hypothetical protein
MGLALDHAGTGDQEKLARAYMHRTDFKRVAHELDCSGFPGSRQTLICAPFAENISSA